MTHRRVIPHFHGTPQAVARRPTRCGTSHVGGRRQGCPSLAEESHFGWGVPVWLGCPSCGSSHFEASCPTPSGPSQCPVGRPAWVGCPSLGRLSRVCWVVPVLTGSSQLRVIPAGGCVISQKPMNSHLPANNHTSCEIARAAYVLLVVLVEPSTCNTIKEAPKIHVS